MKKIFGLFLALLLFAGAFATPVYANALPSEVSTEETSSGELDEYRPQARWSATHSITHGVILSGGVANAVCSVRAYNSTSKVYTSLTLQKFEGGRWVDLQTWWGNGTFTCGISSYRAVPQGTYRTRTTGTIYTVAGAYLESVTVYSTPKSH